MKLTYAVLAIIAVLTLGACGASKDSLCMESARLTKRASELIVLGVANPKNFDEAELKQVTDDLAAVGKKLNGATCP